MFKYYFYIITLYIKNFNSAIPFKFKKRLANVIKTKFKKTTKKRNKLFINNINNFNNPKLILKTNDDNGLYKNIVTK